MTSEITTKENVTLPEDQLTAAVEAIQPLIAERQKLIKQGTNVCAEPCRSDNEEEASYLSEIKTLTNKIIQADRQKVDTTSLYQEKANLEKLADAWARQKDLDCKTLDGSLNGSGTIRPKFLPLFVIYAPPGANGGKGSSTADYGVGSVLETNLSTTNSYTDDLKASISFSGGAFGNDASLTISEDNSLTTSKMTTADIKETVTDSIHVPGPSSDGIDHDFDRIYVLLNPNVILTTTNVGTTWSLGTVGNYAHIQYATVGELKGKQALPPGVKSDFDQAGLTPADFSILLAIDPLANSASTIETNRFILLPTSMPYDPPPTSTATPGSETHVVTDSEQNTQKTSVDDSNAIGITVGASVGSPFAQTKLSVAFEFTYKYSNSLAQTNGASQSIAFTIGQPAYGYSGPADVYVYKDSIFNTYAFTLTAPRDWAMLASGKVTDMNGVAARNVEIELDLGASSFRTVSGVDGVYRIWGKRLARPMVATLKAATTNSRLTLGSTVVRHDIKLPGMRPR